MKSIKNYNSEKYKKTKSKYTKVKDGVYEMINGKSKVYVTSLSFVQEPKYEEGEKSSKISQYPLEDILDKFYCYISDFYDDINKKGNNECVLEFASDSLDDIVSLRGIIGKHVYNSKVEKDGKTYIKLVIE